MRLPLALGNFGIAEHGAERGILRTAGIDAKQDFTAPVPQMADAELRKMDAVAAAFHAVITLPAAQPVPHFFHIGGNVGGGPIGIPVVCHDAAQSLEAFVFIFDGSFQPVFAVQINGHAALVEMVFAFELRFHRERKIGLLRSVGMSLLSFLHCNSGVSFWNFKFHSLFSCFYLIKPLSFSKSSKSVPFTFFIASFSNSFSAKGNSASNNGFLSIA